MPACVCVWGAQLGRACRALRIAVHKVGSSSPPVLFHSTLSLTHPFSHPPVCPRAKVVICVGSWFVTAVRLDPFLLENRLFNHLWERRTRSCLVLGAELLPRGRRSRRQRDEEKRDPKRNQNEVINNKQYEEFTILFYVGTSNEFDFGLGESK